MQNENPEKVPSGRTFPGRCHLSLEKQLQGKLDLSGVVRSITSRSNPAKVGRGEVARVANRDDTVAAEIRSIEVRMVEDVEELGPEL